MRIKGNDRAGVAGRGGGRGGLFKFTFSVFMENKYTKVMAEISKIQFSSRCLLPLIFNDTNEQRGTTRVVCKRGKIQIKY